MKPCPGSLDTLRLYRVGSLIADPFTRIDRAAEPQPPPWPSIIAALAVPAAIVAAAWWRLM